MAVKNQPKLMSIVDIRLRRGTTVVQFELARQMRVTDMVVSGTLRGSSKLGSTTGYIEGAEVVLEAGGLPVDAFPVLYGFDLPATTGTAPNRKRTIEVPASRAFGYFEAKGRSLGDDGDDVIVYLPKVQITSGSTITMQDGANHTVTELNGMAHPVQGVTYERAYDVIIQETVAPIAFTTLTLTDISVTDNIATATVADSSALAPNDMVYIFGTTADYLEGWKQVIDVPLGTTFTFIAGGADTTGDSGFANL